MALDLYDTLYLNLNGDLQTENVCVSFWTDAAGKRHVSAENLLHIEKPAEFDAEQARAAGRVIHVSVMRGGNGERVGFMGKVSQAGMRAVVGQKSVITFQIDEQ